MPVTKDPDKKKYLNERDIILQAFEASGIKASAEKKILFCQAFTKALEKILLSQRDLRLTKIGVFRKITTPARTQRGWDYRTREITEHYYPERRRLFFKAIRAFRILLNRM